MKALIAHDLMFHADDIAIASSFQPYDADSVRPEAVSRFEPWAEDDAPTPTPSFRGGAGASPTQAGQGGSSVTIRRRRSPPATPGRDARRAARRQPRIDDAGAG